MDSLFQDELERKRKQLAEVGVTPEMTAAAGLLPVAQEAPKHWAEAARERDGNAKFFGKMLLGGMTGMMPFIFPEAIGGNARYKVELEQHLEAQEKMKELQALAGIDPMNPSVVDIARATDANKVLGDFYSGNYIGNQNSGSWIDDIAKRANLSYQEFMELGEETRNNLIYQHSTPEERETLDWIDKRTTPQQDADAAAMKVAAEERARGEVEDERKLSSQMPQLEAGFNIIGDILNQGTYQQIYGKFDANTPTIRPSSQDVKTKIDKISAILYMFARGELKGQGQVTEDEARWAMKSRSTLQDFQQSDEAAMQEMMDIQRQLGEYMGITDESRYFNPDLDIDDLIEMYNY